MNTRKLVALMLAVSFVGSAVAGCRNGRCGRRRPVVRRAAVGGCANGRCGRPAPKPVAKPAPVKNILPGGCIPKEQKVEQTNKFDNKLIHNIGSEKQFDALVSEKKNVMVKFSATWCAPCKEFAPTFETSAKAHTDVTFVSVDIEAVSELADRFEITSVPAVIFIKDGEVAKTTSGLMTAEQLDEYIKEVYAQA